MKPFMDKDFLLETDVAKHLFHDIAADCPIIDYHCHLNPREIWEDRRFENITQVWLGGDHYKWRLMRSFGVEEKFITGDASDREKFQKWAETLALAIGNPLYHWSHLELRRYFGYEGILNGDTAEAVWVLCNEKLRQPDFSARSQSSKNSRETARKQPSTWPREAEAAKSRLPGRATQVLSKSTVSRQYSAAPPRSRNRITR